jgi:glycosyltransferase involved in cell wall biosynthesis
MKVGVYLGAQQPDAGGGYTFQADLLSAFIEIAAESRHQFVVLVAPQYADLTRSRFSAANVEVAALPAPGFLDRVQSALQRDFAAVRQRWRRDGVLQRCARKRGLDFIWFLSSDCHLLETPYLAVVWDLQHRTLPWFPEVTHHGEFEAREASNRWFLQRATIVVTGTQAGAEEIERFYQVDPHQIHRLPHPTPAYALAALAAGSGTSAIELKRHHGIRGSFILYPAQLWPHKNHVNLLHALKILREQYCLDVELVLVGGDKGNRAYCETVAVDLGLMDHCHFLGFVSQDDLIGLYRAATAMAYVSFGGPENLPPLEAFALGCPVVAADVRGASEQLGDCAVFADPANPASIASALHSLIVSPERADSLRALGHARAHAWTGLHFVRAVFGLLERFEPVRRTWGLQQ